MLAAGNHHFISRLDHFTVTFGVNKLREILVFPQTNARQDRDGFEPFDDLETVLASIMFLGYKGVLPKVSAFNKKYLPTLYNTLFIILNRCLTGNNSGIDTIKQPMALLFQGVVEDRHYDYAQLIFSDLVEMVIMRKNKKTMKYLSYVLLFSKILHSAMMQNPDIPRRINHQITELYHMHFIRYSNEEFELERPLIPVVLIYADQHAPSVIAYRTVHALMVQPEPEGPVHSAHRSSEGVGSRDFEPGVQG